MVGEAGETPWLVVAEAKRIQILSLQGEPIQIVDPQRRSGTLWGLTCYWPAGLIFATDGHFVHVVEFLPRLSALRV